MVNSTAPMESKPLVAANDTQKHLSFTVAPAKAKVTDRWNDGQTDDWQSDPYVAICFNGASKTEV